MNQTNNALEESKKTIQNILYECETCAAWTGHEYATNYLEKEYVFMIGFADKHGIDISKLIAAHDESESYMKAVYDNSNERTTWEQEKKLNRLESEFIDCMYHTAEEFEAFILKTEP